ncbi:MAG: 50S ribosomal protein L6 [Acidimicrobiia bacterium]|nr:50S ribosomal protein L6 [Acidimicrobiia bacterium]
MSRVGKAPITVPAGVEVTIAAQTVTVKGAKGTLQRTFSERVKVTQNEDQLLVERFDDERDSRAQHGLVRALLANMVTGVSDGFAKKLAIVGVGYRAAMKGSSLELQVGFSHPVLMDPPDGITIEVPDPTNITVSGINKELVGQVAADIRDVRPPEPYKGKGIRYVDEYVRRKAGKAGVAR